MLFKIINTIVQIDVFLVCFFIQRDTSYKLTARLVMLISIILLIAGLFKF